MKEPWKPPKDLDPECLALCVALNKLPWIFTTCSCCGHGQHPFWIFFKATSLRGLPKLCYWFDECHTGAPGWRVRVYTDCAMSGPFFMIEGPTGDVAYKDAAHIAKFIEANL